MRLGGAESVLAVEVSCCEEFPQELWLLLLVGLLLVF